MQAQASGYRWAKCPCKFWSALYFAQKAAAKIDGHFIIEECVDDGDSIEASGEYESDENGCKHELEAETDDENSGFECGYEFQCGDVEVEEGEIDVEDKSFAMALDLSDLTEAEFEACRREIKLISKFRFGVYCE